MALNCSVQNSVPWVLYSGAHAARRDCYTFEDIGVLPGKIVSLSREKEGRVVTTSIRGFQTRFCRETLENYHAGFWEIDKGGLGVKDGSAGL